MIFLPCGLHSVSLNVFLEGQAVIEVKAQAPPEEFGAEGSISGVQSEAKVNSGMGAHL